MPMTFKATTASEVVLELAYLLRSNAAVLSRANPTPLGADKLMEVGVSRQHAALVFQWLAGELENVHLFDDGKLFPVRTVLLNEMARVADRIERTKEGESVQLSS